MKNRWSKWIIAFILCTLLVVPYVVLANSAEPPSVIILVNNPPRDLSIELITKTKTIKPKVNRVAWEGQYTFYKLHNERTKEYRFLITTKDKTFECTYGDGRNLERYSETFVLDIKEQKLIRGVYPLRSAILISIRILLTLLIEGAIFWGFGFRLRKSWMVFLVVNLVTQGILNTLLFAQPIIIPGYLIIGLVFGEIFVFITEMISMPLLIKEKKGITIVGYAFIANMISLFLGGYLITRLPV